MKITLMEAVMANLAAEEVGRQAGGGREIAAQQAVDLFPKGFGAGFGHGQTSSGFLFQHMRRPRPQVHPPPSFAAPSVRGASGTLAFQP